MALEIITEDFELFWKRGKDENYKRADYDELIKAYEKQIPKKPRYLETIDNEFCGCLCPNCDGIDFGYNEPNYCENCGQAIDWSEVE